MAGISFLKPPCPNPSYLRPFSLSDVRLAPSGSLPSNQQLHRYNGQKRAWIPLRLPLSQSAGPSNEIVPRFRVATWNIEFSSPHIFQRTKAILSYLQSDVLTSTPGALGVPTIILFQEVDEEAFPAFLSSSFLQDNYDLTDVSTENFARHYGTVTLIPRALTPFVSAIARIPFKTTRMGRDALTVDLDLPRAPDHPCSFPFLPVISRIRICNVHLESLRGYGDIARPKQLHFVSGLLSAAEGGIVAGDMNAIAPTDSNSPQMAGLADCWEVMRPEATAEEGHTWGYQPRKRFLPDRLDKVLISGRLAPVFIERFGVNRSFTLRWDKVWLSDHYGLLTEFRLM